jgi:hypothetical protein
MAEKKPAETTAADDSSTSTASATSSEDENQASLAKMAGLDPKEMRDPTKAPADQTEIVVIDGQEAAKTPKGDGMYGMAHATPEGEVGGGNIAGTLDPPADATRTIHPLTAERAALLSPVARAIAGYVQRPVSEWGVLGPGDIVKGHMLLLDLNTGEKVRGMDGHKIGEGKLYANLRNMPEALSTGDTIEQLLGSH